MKYIIPTFLLFLDMLSLNLSAQDIKKDTLTGTFTNLNLAKGSYYVNSVIIIKENLTIAPGVKIELIDNGRIVCEGGVNANGVFRNIEILGKTGRPGVGMVIKNTDSSSVNLSNIIFKNLQIPLLFDFGWKRSIVNIRSNLFVNNIGKVSIIQVLNQPFSYTYDTTTAHFNIIENSFAGNNAPIYFEDLKSDHLKISILNNVFINNRVYGFKNYNIATNMIYGRADQFFNKYAAVIEGNSFVSNNLMDSYTDSLVHSANFGLYGSDKNFSLKQNYLGRDKKEYIINTIYDQTINYSSPKIDFEPFLTKPNNITPSHIYQILNKANKIIEDTQAIKIPIDEFQLLSNTAIDYSKSLVVLTSFSDDTTELLKNDTLNYTINKNNNTANFKLTKSTNIKSKLIKYTITNIKNVNDEVVPDVELGYYSFLYEYRKRKPYALIKVELTNKDTIPVEANKIDTADKNNVIVQPRIKNKLEMSISSGGVIFLGTISNANYFQNDINVYTSVSFNYKMYSNLSLNLSVANFKLSNTDYKSGNNEQLSRGMSFTTNMMSVSPSLEIDFVNNRLTTKEKNWRPSIEFGVDLISFNPTSIYKGTTYNLQSLGTGGQFLDSLSKPYSLITQGYFLDAKLKYQISKRNSIGIHFSIHKSLSDYLDDVGSDAYPDPAKIYKTSKTFPEAAVYFSNPTSRTTNYGQLRNSPNSASDIYLIFGVFYSFKF